MESFKVGVEVGECNEMFGDIVIEALTVLLRIDPDALMVGVGEELCKTGEKEVDAECE
jgi:hypothetical protein